MCFVETFYFNLTNYYVYQNSLEKLKMNWILLREMMNFKLFINERTNLFININLFIYKIIDAKKGPK